MLTRLAWLKQAASDEEKRLAFVFTKQKEEKEHMFQCERTINFNRLVITMHLVNNKRPALRLIDSEEKTHSELSLRYNIKKGL